MFFPGERMRKERKIRSGLRGEYMTTRGTNLVISVVDFGKGKRVELGMRLIFIG